jgi:hypothetical protein
MQDGRVVTSQVAGEEKSAKQRQWQQATRNPQALPPSHQ